MPHGRGRDLQPVRDLGIGQPLPEQAEELFLVLGQRIVFVLLPEQAFKPVGMLSIEMQEDGAGRLEKPPAEREHLPRLKGFTAADTGIVTRLLIHAIALPEFLICHVFRRCSN